MKLQIVIDDNKYELDVEVIEEDPVPRARGYLPPYGPSSTLRTLQDPTPPAAGSTAAPAETSVDEAHVCRSPVAGVVVRVNVQPGQVLQQDDPIMALEAMKMETNVTASAAGTVKAIKVAVGDGVKVNQVLVEFE